jgi:protein Tex
MDAEAVRVALAPEALAPPIAKELGLPAEAVQAGLSLLAEGAQPAFVARYRAERTGALSIRDLERIQAAAARAAAFEFRRQEVREDLERRSLLDGPIAHYVARARHPIDLDDLKVVAKKRKRGGPAAKARAAGLVPLAEALWQGGSSGSLSRREAKRLARAQPGERAEPREHADAAHANPEEPVERAQPAEQAEQAPPVDQVQPAAPVQQVEVEQASDIAQAEPVEREVDAAGVADPVAAAAALTSEAFPTPEDALAGARAICAEQLAEAPAVRAKLRRLLLDRGKIHTRVIESKKDKASRYSKFFDRAESCKGMAVNNVLAVHRAEREGLLTIDIEVEPERIRDTIADALRIDAESPSGVLLLEAADEAWAHGLGRVVQSGVRKLIKQRADRQAIQDLGDVLRPLLLAPALGRAVVLGIDPGHQQGCRLVVVDEDGNVVADDTVYPLQPKLQAPQAKARIVELCRTHAVAAIAVGSGGGGRDVERLCRDALREAQECKGVAVVSVDSDVAALSAASRHAKEEGSKDAAVRRAASLARRVQDPLAELSKVDPRKLGLGQYQHEVDSEELRAALEQVLASCTSEVTLDVNTAPVEQLARVAGLSQALAKGVIAQRETNGPYRSRQALLDVPGVAGKAFEQCSGFLRVIDGDQPLDATRIHPERYGQVTQMARELGVTVADLLGNAELVDKIEVERHLGQPGSTGEPLGRPTMDDLLEQLRCPGAGTRPPFVSVEFNPDLRELSDLKVGMELDGIVTHLAAFGAFIDVGLPHEGLVHVSELSHEYVKSPLEAVHVGQKVRGRIIDVEPERKRFALSLKALQPRPERKEVAPKRRGKGRATEGAKDADRGKGADRGKPRGKGKGPPRGRDGDGDKKQRSDRTLGFRLDLSELAARLDKGS